MGIYLATSDLLYIGKGYQNDFRSATSRTRVDQGGPGAGRGGHRLCTDGSGEMAGPRTGVVYHVDQGLLATSNGNRTTISFLLMHAAQGAPRGGKSLSPSARGPYTPAPTGLRNPSG
jgi:hypothetical protein